MFSNRALAKLRYVIEKAALTDRCRIVRMTTASDGQGGTTRTATDIAMNVPYRVDRSFQYSTEDESGTRVVAKRGFLLHLPHDQDVIESDKIIDERNGRVFHVLGRRPITDELKLLIEAEEIGKRGEL